jgi:hypothetical protein
MVKESNMNVGIPMGLTERLDRYLESNDAKELGLSSRRQTMIMLLRNFLKDVESKVNELDKKEYENLKYIDTLKNKNVKILDMQSNEEIVLAYDKKNISYKCGKCDFSHCVHISFLFELSSHYNHLVTYFDKVPLKIDKLAYDF